MDTADSYQGQRLGLPRDGVGSVGSFLRRLVALLIDWTLCQLVAGVLFGMTFGEVAGWQAFGPLALFFVVNVALVTTIGTTIGHRLLGIRVVSVDGAAGTPPPPGRAALRALLLCLFVPAVILDADGRGLHDKAGRAVVVQAR